MQIPIVSGIYTAGGDFRTAYPVNLVPVPKATGISDGYLLPFWGCVLDGVGLDRGGIEWRGSMYRVLGADLCRIADDGAVSVIGAIGGSGLVHMTYGFDHLAVASSGQLWLYDGSTLAQVTDIDLGTVLDVEWIDGYFMTIDGEFLTVTELTNPFDVNPLRYGSSEADPDPIEALIRLRSEIYALNRYTIEVFSNVGGTGFPFQRITGAQIQRGAVGTHACCVFGDGIAFLGSGRGEAVSVYIGGNGSSAKIGTREIDLILAEYTEAQLSSVLLESMMEAGHNLLFVHLARHTLVYDLAATAALGSPVWFHVSSSLDGSLPWAARNLIWCYGRWNVGHTEGLGFGHLTRERFDHWGERVTWQFTTPIVYNDSRGAVFHELELVALPGWAAIGDDAKIMGQYSLDGAEWSQPRFISAGVNGQRAKRLSWRNNGRMGNYRMQRVTGTSDAPLAAARLEARLEPLAF
jgi:hypothetical protein